MAHSLESRVPFLDNDLVDYAMKIPVNLKLGNLKKIIKMNENQPGLKTQKYFQKTNDGKLVLRQMLNKYVPDQVTNMVKQGFSSPDQSWFKGESISFVKDKIGNKRAKIYQYMNPRVVNRLVGEHLNGKVNRRLLIWSLLNFEEWLHQNEI